MVTAVKNTRIFYKYFHFTGGSAPVILRLRASSGGRLDIFADQSATPAGFCLLSPSPTWQELNIPCSFPVGRHALRFDWHGSGKLHILDFSVRTR